MSAVAGRTSFVLTRHGQTVWHEENRYAGTSDIDLDEVGRRQSAELADWVLGNPPSAVVSSPLRRAQQTAGPSASVVGLELTVMDALREVHFGVAEGHTLSELATRDAQMVARFREDPVDHHFPGGEPTAQAAARGAAALRRLATEHDGGTVLVVAHNTLLRLALCELVGIDVRRYRDVFPQLRNGAISELTLPSAQDGSAALLSLNVPLGPVRSPARAPRPPIQGNGRRPARP